jgi:hypothetical protein
VPASELPAWVQYSQALLTPVIALIAAGIAFMQWRTAHQKVVLDLFERRMQAYLELQKPLVEVLSTNEVPRERLHEFRRAIGQTDFLFGDEVVKYLLKIHEALVRLQDHNMMLGIEDDPEKRRVLIEQRKPDWDTIRLFFGGSEAIFAPCLQMDQKLVWRRRRRRFNQKRQKSVKQSTLAFKYWPGRVR